MTDAAVINALSGAIIAGLALVSSLVYAALLPDAVRALRWWAGAFFVQTLALSIQLWQMLEGNLPRLMPLGSAGELTNTSAGTTSLFLIDGLYALGGHLLFVGALRFFGKSLKPILEWGGVVVALILWPILADLIRPVYGLQDIPLISLAGLAEITAGILFLRTPPEFPGMESKIPAVLLIFTGILDFFMPALVLEAGYSALAYMGHLAAFIMLAISLLIAVLRRQELRAEQSQKQANLLQQRFADAIESLNAGFVLYDPDDRLITCNRTYLEAFPGLEEKIKPGISFAEVVDLVAKTGSVKAAVGREEEWKTERLALHRHPGMSVEQTLANGKTVMLTETITREGGRVSIRNDITLLKRQEQEVAKHFERLLVILENIPQGVALYDSEYRLVVANRLFNELLDLPPHIYRKEARFSSLIREMAVRDVFGQVRSPGHLDQIISQQVSELNLRQYRRSEWTLRSAGEIEKILVVECSSLPDDGVLATFRDITERKREESLLLDAKEAAERGNRTKAAFLANISHELRTPLNAIIGFSEVMSAELFGPMGNKSYKEYAHDIFASGSHLLNLINDILDMSKAEAGRIELMDEPFNLHEMANLCVRMINQRNSVKGVHITNLISKDFPYLLADERRIRQVLLNLLSNAAKFTESGGRVELTASILDNGDCQIAIADTGIGMTEEDIKNALEPFGQVDSRLSRRFEGTGLGLPLSKTLVELHGGNVTINSEVGVGTTVLFILPGHRVLSEEASKNVKPVNTSPVDDYIEYQENNAN